MERIDAAKIHNASMQVLKDTGVAFYSQEVLDLFKSHGFKTDGQIVFFSEKHIGQALNFAPATFTVYARNPDKNLEIGAIGQIVLAPGYGAPFVINSSGERNKATIEDYRIFCKLVQTSDVVNINGFLMGDPSDLDPSTYHLDMLFNSITLCDKPFMGSPLSKKSAIDSVRMGATVFADNDKPMMVSNINILAPLQFSGDMAEALSVFAAHNQPVIITGGGIMGATAPIRIAGLLAIQNAAVLAGISLVQLIHPGAPVIYGMGGTNLDMQTGDYYAGSPEAVKAIRVGTSMAKFYGLPSKCGGTLNDAHAMDFQAGYQSAMALAVCYSAGVSFVLQACGLLGTFMSMSAEKFVADEEICKYVLKAFSALDISESSIDVQTISEVGVGGEYLTHRTTLERCRTEFLSLPLANRLPYDKWTELDPNDYNDRASLLVASRIDNYQKPEIDSDLENALTNYVETRKEEK
jgi:trimethylamine--corrinoid protein Co-methyltransferase